MTPSGVAAGSLLRSRPHSQLRWLSRAKASPVWRVHGLQFPDYGAALAVFDINGSGDFDSDGEVAAALAAGAATDLGVVKSFVCAVIPAPTP